MANNRSVFEENHFYHVYNRGFEKKILFTDTSDFERFYKMMVRYLQEYENVKMISYCILPNHFHFILRQTKTGLDISEFMRKLQVSYAMFLKKTNKTGLIKKGEPIFEWRFKAKHIDTDEYFHQCLTYVNYNAQKHGIVTDIKDYPYTSYHKLTDNDKSKLWVLSDLGELEY